MADVFTKAGAIEVAVKAGKTFVQAFVGSLTVFTGFADVDWRASLGAALIAAVTSVSQNMSGTGTSKGRHAA
ncbi:hypothetical protein GS966_11315 [Rhodococcus hoagii]|nr:hypothetical protein [Prescottella equi]